jgi:hypothetical protein
MTVEPSGTTVTTGEQPLLAELADELGCSRDDARTALRDAALALTRASLSTTATRRARKRRAHPAHRRRQLRPPKRHANRHASDASCDG